MGQAGCVFRKFFEAYAADRAALMAAMRAEQSDVSENEKNLAHEKWGDARRQFDEAHAAAQNALLADGSRGE